MRDKQYFLTQDDLSPFFNCVFQEKLARNNFTNASNTKPNEKS